MVRTIKIAGDRYSGTPPQHSQPQEHTGQGQDDKQPAKTSLHQRKRQTDRRRQQKNHVNGIGETLLVFGIIGPSRFEWTPVVSGSESRA